MSPTVEKHFTNAHALGLLYMTLVADRGRSNAAASACNRHFLQTRWALALMARLLAFVSAVESLPARFRTIRDGILTVLPDLARDLAEACFTTRTASDNVG